MTDDLVKRLADVDPILATEFDTQLGVRRDPHGATRAIEMALYLLRDQADRIEALTARAEAAEGKLDAVTAGRDRLRVALNDLVTFLEGTGFTTRFCDAARAELKREQK